MPKKKDTLLRILVRRWHSPGELYRTLFAPLAQLIREF
jgi:hypothetical protein